MTTENAVTGTFRYTAPMAVEPEYFLYDPGPEREEHEPRAMRVRDGRGHEGDFALDQHGFALIDFDAPARYIMHAAFEDPTSPPDPQPRISIEARTIAMF